MIALRRVFQDRFGGFDALPHERGNCWPACIAQITGYRLDDVPHVHAEHETTMAANEEMQRWLHAHGWSLFAFNWPEPFPFVPPGTVAILSGPSPRLEGALHAVVGTVDCERREWQLLHDPHPEGAGIMSLSFVEILFRPVMP